jgi:trehalose-6-phosphate synthase
VFGIRTGKGRTVTLTTSHAGIDSKLVAEAMAKVKLAPLKQKGPLVVCSVDEVEGLRGLALKMLAFDRFLTVCIYLSQVKAMCMIFNGLRSLYSML